jgi:hypothetical protein
MVNLPGISLTFTIDTASSSGPAIASNAWQSVPVGSTVTRAPDRVSKEKLTDGTYRFTYSFKPDKGGIYLLQASDGALLATIAIAEKLTKSMRERSSTSYASATLTLYLVNGSVASTTTAVEGEATPSFVLDSSSAKNAEAMLAMADPHVKSALAALAGKTANELKATYYPNLLAAWKTALLAPTSPSISDGTEALMADGWTLAN